MKTLRGEFEQHFGQMDANARRLLASVWKNTGRLAQMAALVSQRRGVHVSPEDLEEQLELEAFEYSFAHAIAKQAKTILFPGEQADVFLRLARTYRDELDFRLPFDDLLLQFARPVQITVDGVADQLIALLLQQQVMTEEGIARARAIYELRRLAGTHMTLPSVEPEMVVNNLIAVFGDRAIRKITWLGGKTEIFETSDKDDLETTLLSIRDLAVACIGYINCENIYLHREEVPEKVSRKREAKGKSRLEPYYVCRIRGVQYDSAGHVGTGAEHGHRYDVRGHFRKLESGKTTWVRPHQRGLKHELYIPKTYVVDRRQP